MEEAADKLTTFRLPVRFGVASKPVGRENGAEFVDVSDIEYLHGTIFDFGSSSFGSGDGDDTAEKEKFPSNSINNDYDDCVV